MSVATFTRRWLAPVLAGALCAILVGQLTRKKERPVEESSPSSPLNSSAALETKDLAEQRDMDPGKKLLARELEELAASILKEPWPDHFLEVAVRGVLGEFASSYPKEFLHWIERAKPSQDLSWAIKLASVQLALNDPEGAIRAIARLGNPWQRLEAWMTAFQSIAGRNPAQAAALLSHVDSQFRSRLTGIIAEQWAKSDPESAARFINQLEASTVRENLLRSTLGRWANKDFEAARNWAKQNNLQRTFVSSLIANGSPKLAAQALSEAPIRNKEIYLRSLASRWSAEDPVAALQWATAQQNPRDRAIMTRSLLDRVINSNPTLAASILENVPSRELREGFYRKLAQNKSSADPKDAMSWTTSLSDPVSRFNASRTVLAMWGTKDPHAAVTYVYGNAASETERRAWLNAVIDSRLSLENGDKRNEALLFLQKLPSAQQQEVMALMENRRKVTSKPASGL